ncbi:MAG TPA: hypothetical protein VF855_08340 [Acidimicrobiales bacterium]
MLGAVAVLIGGWLVIDSRTSEDFPSEWDPKVAALVNFVEREKGADFAHPVPVRFLDEAAFDEEVTRDNEDLTDEDKTDYERAEGALRAVGLFSGEGSLFEQSNDLAAGGISAFYNPDSAEVVVSGNGPLDVLTRVVLVHELTHALQDQLGQLDVETDSSDADDAFHAIVEGDAQRVEYAYIDDLSDSEREQYEEASSAEREAAEGDLGDVSPALTTMFSARYTLGYAVVQTLFEAGGREAVNDRLDSPPQSTADIMTPRRWAQGTTLVPVDAPEPPTGAEEVEEPDVYGAVAVYLTLASVTGVEDALAAADAWGGDQYVAYSDSSGRRCLRANFVPLEPAGMDDLASAWTTWAASRPSGTAAARTSGDRVELEACEPDSDEGSKELTAAEAGIPEQRAIIVIQMTGGPDGYAFDTAACLADHIVHQTDPDVLAQDELSDAQIEDIWAIIELESEGCGA